MLVWRLRHQSQL